MKKKRTINSIIGTILIFGFSILIASFGSLQAIKPSMKMKKVLTPITTTDTVSVQKKTKRVEQEANITNELPENSDDYKTSYWIGSVPELLKDSIHTAGLVFIDSTAFSKDVPANIQEVYINADGVPSIAHFVDSPFFKSMTQNKIRAIIYNNKANNKDEQLVFGLGGMNTFNADFIMIVYKESGLSIIPVGNETMQYKPKRLSVFQASNFEGTPINNEKNLNARMAVNDNGCGGWPHLYKMRKHARNRFPSKIEKAKLWWKKPKFFDSVSATVLCDNTKPEYKYKLLKTQTVDRGQLRPRVDAGTGTVTLRYNQETCNEVTAGKTSGWQVSTTIGKSTGFDYGNIRANFTIKARGSYGENGSEGYAQNICNYNGYTFYTNPCAYACCSSELSADVLQETYKVTSIPVGSIWINYSKIASTWKKAKAGKWTNLSQPVTLRFRYSQKSPLYGSWKETSELFVSLIVSRFDKNCNPKSCYGYTSGKCNQSVK